MLIKKEISVQCAFCGVTFKRSLREIKKNQSKQIFCSQACNGLVRRTLDDGVFRNFKTCHTCRREYISKRARRTKARDKVGHCTNECLSLCKDCAPTKTCVKCGKRDQDKLVYRRCFPCYNLLVTWNDDMELKELWDINQRLRAEKNKRFTRHEIRQGA